MAGAFNRLLVCPLLKYAEGLAGQYHAFYAYHFAVNH